MIVASHRGPITPIVSDNGETEFRASTGGLVTAIASGGSAPDSVWLTAASARDASLLPPRDIIAAQPLAQAARWLGQLAFVAITPAVHDLYYNDMCNSLLWPFFHACLARSEQFSPAGRNSGSWRAYVEVNRLFAAAIGELAGKDETVIIHDYHLMLVPGMLRQQRKDLRLAYFHHIPFTAPDEFTTLPRSIQRSLIDSLNVAPAGFQSMRWRDAFEAVCSALTEDRKSYSFVHGVGPNTEDLRAEADSPRVKALRRELRESIGDRFLVGRADRADPMKNIEHGIRAMDALLEAHPQHVDRVVFVNHVVPTRLNSPAYARCYQNVRAAAESVNRKWSTGSWAPIVLDAGDDYARGLSVLAEYDALMVNPIREGMNLVAQEGPLVNERDGVLLLSSSAGSHDLLQGAAITLDPQSVRSTWLSLHQAIEMTAGERARRADLLRRRVVAADGAQWHEGLRAFASAAASAS